MKKKTSLIVFTAVVVKEFGEHVIVSSTDVGLTLALPVRRAAQVFKKHLYNITPTAKEVIIISNKKIPIVMEIDEQDALTLLSTKITKKEN